MHNLDPNPLSAALFSAFDALPASKPLLSGHGKSYCVSEIKQTIAALVQRLHCQPGHVVGLLADNGPAWAWADLATLQAGRVQLPLPAFFSDAQLRHALNRTQTDLVLTDQAARIIALDLGFSIVDSGQGLTLLRRRADFSHVKAAIFPPGTVKISFTSGSTGQPKGVCLSALGLLDTAQAIVATLADLPLAKHLAVLPLALLLENVAGLYAPLLRATEIVLPPLADLGWRGMGGFDARQLAHQVDFIQPNSLILLPELLKFWTLALQSEHRTAPACLQFVAVGGARCDVRLLTDARALGLPAYEGYGLTECGSVVSLNRAGADQLGSVGQPLSHIKIHINAAGEILIKNRAFLGYLSEEASTPTVAPETFPSGDLAQIDQNNFLTLSGRQKNLLITSYGRNISPEWVEAALLAAPEIAQAMTLGDARPWLAALLVPMPGVEQAVLARAVARINATLPEYARINNWIQCKPFTAHDGLLTGNGRPIRSALMRRYATEIESIYLSKE